jgi:hypothetical protein
MNFVRSGFAPPQLAGARHVTRPAFGPCRSYFETGFNGSPLHNSGCTRKEKGFPVLFPTPYSFLFTFEKSDFYSRRVSSQSDEGSFPCLSPVLSRDCHPAGFVPSAFLRNKSHPHPLPIWKDPALPTHIHSRLPIHGDLPHNLKFSFILTYSS